MVCVLGCFGAGEFSQTVHVQVKVFIIYAYSIVKKTGIGLSFAHLLLDGPLIGLPPPRVCHVSQQQRSPYLLQEGNQVGGGARTERGRT